jgi:hypothetical protein
MGSVGRGLANGRLEDDERRCFASARARFAIGQSSFICRQHSGIAYSMRWPGADAPSTATAVTGPVAVQRIATIVMADSGTTDCATNRAQSVKAHQTDRELFGWMLRVFIGLHDIIR